MDRAAHWERVYQARLPTEVSWHQASPERSLRLIQVAGLDKADPVIDIGGGASLLVDRLIAAGYRDVTVLDLAAGALDHVRRRLGSPSGLELIQADITRWTPRRQYALWHDRAVLHFLTDPSDRVAYVTTLCSALRPGGHAVIATFAPDGPVKCSGLPVERYDAQRLAGLLGGEFHLRSSEREPHQTPAGATQHFQYAWFTRTPLPPSGTP